MRLFSMVGFKLFKVDENDEVHMLRIVNVPKPIKGITSKTEEPSVITVYDYDEQKKKKVNVKDIKEYTPLEPDGIITASIAKIYRDKEEYKDVIVTATKYLELKITEDITPFAVCRQSITDFYQNLFVRNEMKDTLVGVSVNRNTCPSNFDFVGLLATDEIIYSDFVNIYRTDTLEDIYPMVKMSKFDDCLKDLFRKHIKYINKPELMFKHEVGGWCDNLKLLLEQNNFQADINEMLGIIQVDFNIKDYAVNKELPNDKVVEVANEELTAWLSLTTKAPIKEAAIVEFDHDINLADYNNNTYLIIRDNTSTLYLVGYICEGEFHLTDLEEKAKELDFSTKFRLSFYNKYN